MPVLVSSSVLESSILGEGVPEKTCRVGLKARQLNPGILELGLGHRLGLGRGLVADELRLVNERIVSKRVVGGDWVAPRHRDTACP